MTNRRRIIALIMTVLMLTVNMPSVSVFAEDAVTDTGQAVSEEVTEGSDGELTAGESEEETEESTQLSAEEASPENEGEGSVSEDEAGIEAMAAGSSRSAEQIVKSMSTRQKICQCLMMDFRRWKDADGKEHDMTVLEDDVADAIANYQFGGIILFSENIKTTEDSLKLTKDMQAAAVRKGGLPLLIATDQEGGNVYRLGSGTALPGNMAVAATGDTANAKTSAEIIGRELSSIGINTTMAPVVDVNSNAANPIIGIRSFGDDPDIVGNYGKAFISGLDEYGMVGGVKHFPGHGDTNTDSHTGLPSVDKTKTELYKCELKPFKAAIDSGADMIMTAHIIYPKIDSTKIRSIKTGQDESRPATMSKKILTDILRGEMGYDGVIVTDAMNMQGVSDYFERPQAAYEALMAGADIICMPVEKVVKDGYLSDKEELDAELESLISYIENKVKKDPAARRRLNNAVTRIIRLKQEKGILDYDAAQYTEERAKASVRSEENLRLEREMASAAVTVVRNDNDTLPFRTTRTTKVLMLCPYNNERALMVIGLNRAKAAGLVPRSVSVDVYRFSSDDAKDDSTLKAKIDSADLVIINSELVDAEDMSYGWFTSSVTRAATDHCKAKGKKSVVMSVNIPYDVQLYPGADAVIAVYGCKGSSMDVTPELVDGDITEDPNTSGPNITAGVEAVFGVRGAGGKLPVDIPRFEQAESGIGSYTDEIVYKRGYGITYDSLKPTVAHASIALSSDSFVFNGSVQRPSVTVTDTLGRILTEGRDYTLENAGRKDVGRVSVKVTGKGSYTGTISAAYSIVPKAASVKSLKKGRRRLTLKMKYKPSATGGSGYQAAYKVKGSGEWQYKTSLTKTVKIRKLKKGKRYVVMVRAYKTVNGETFYGAWSRARTSGKV